jgi:HSP20 family protein
MLDSVSGLIKSLSYEPHTIPEWSASHQEVDTTNRPIGPHPQEWNMAHLVRFDPFAGMRSSLFDRMLHDVFTPFDSPAERGEPVERLALDIFEKDGAMIFKAAVPGVDPERVEVTIDDDVLTIRGEASTEDEVEESGYHRRELRFGSFSRAIRLPAGLNTDEAAASFDKGVLRVTIPHAQEAKPKKLKIDVN